MAPVAGRRELVLVGGGHAHVQVLRSWPELGLPDVRLTLVADSLGAVYSGMVPGLAAGEYEPFELEIDLRPLARRAGARVIPAAALRIDADGRRIELRGRAPIRYDIASFDVGCTVAGLDLPGARERALPTRPIGRFVRLLAEARERMRGAPRGRAARIVVVGAGAGGVELAFAIQAGLARETGRKIEVTLVERGDRILAGYPEGLVRLVRRAAAARGVEFRTGRRLLAAEEGELRTEDGGSLPFDILLWVAGASALDLFRDSGLPTDERGFVRVRSTLQVEGHDELFAVGDCASLAGQPRLPKAAAYAVRSGSVLTANLASQLAGRGLRRYRPQRETLSLLNLGNGYAVGCKWGVSFGGAWVSRWKERRDRRFMRRFQVLGPDGAPTPEYRRWFETRPADEMTCGGCAAKLEQPALDRALGRLEFRDDSAVLLGLDAGDDAAAVRTPGGEIVVSSVDLFRPFADDPYRVGSVAAVNAASDLYAKGVVPSFALAIAALPEGEAQAEELLYQVLAGARAAFDSLGVALVGGHTAVAGELLAGFCVFGTGESPERLLRLEGLRPGDRLLLTKPLGTGVLFHADAQGLAPGAWVEAALESMLRANDEASQTALQYGASACTDVSGFGLAGHLGRMLRASKTSAVLNVSELPALPGAIELLERGLRSSAHPANARQSGELGIRQRADLHPRFALLFDPQTSGGLLFGVAAERAPAALAELHRRGDDSAAIIGEVLPASGAALFEVLASRPD